MKRKCEELLENKSLGIINKETKIEDFFQRQVRSERRGIKPKSKREHPILTFILNLAY